MNFWMALLFFMAYSGCIFASASIENEIKHAITIQQERVDLVGPDSKGEATKQLALLYLKDQDQKRAFRTFLEALKFVPKIKVPTETNDLDEYRKAFNLYLDPSAASPQATAKQLIEVLLPILEKNSELHLLNYFVAIAYANLGKYEDFFKYFYNAFQFYPDHYLAYKTKAILQIKLLERTYDDTERAAQRQGIIDNLSQALEREPLDTTIYKLLISFSPKEKKKDQVQLCLKKIINGNIMIPRSELMFYVVEAVNINEMEWCERFISCSKEWYPQSRLVASAHKYLNTRSNAAHKHDAQ